MRLIVIAIFALLLPGLAHASAGAGTSTGAETGPLGRYCGKLKSGTQIVDAETVLRLNPNGLISGSYQFRDQGTVSDGKLQEVVQEPGPTKMLRWTDKYGKGWLIITFDNHFRHFNGFWGSNDAVPDQAWDGERCQAPNS